MDTLKGMVAVVTGGSRGVGKGIALGLGEAGATVYVTGRSTTARASAHPGTIDETAAEIDRLGGRGVPIACDHGNDAEIRALVARVLDESGRIDVLVNNVFAIPDGVVRAPFW